MLRITEVRGGRDLEEVRRLFEQYAAGLEISLEFQGFAEELAALPGAYGPPAGELLLARWHREAAGCVGLRGWGEGICEMKRLYVRPAHRGRGVGWALATAIIAAAVERGYVRMRLDTLPSMVRARALYRALGFRRIAAYRPNPVEGTSFLELRLG